jgi:hypothetical protein
LCSNVVGRVCRGFVGVDCVHRVVNGVGGVASMMIMMSMMIVLLFVLVALLCPHLVAAEIYCKQQLMP